VTLRSVLFAHAIVTGEILETVRTGSEERTDGTVAKDLCAALRLGCDPWPQLETIE